LPNINKEFFDIINQEDWDIEILEEENNMNMFDNPDIPLGDIAFPTPLPGVWINLSLGFNIERPEDFDG
tara:strand:- start:668 stop:874 length:207 start_codon:yes stop_codon:yes gene_type:complete